jgi:hypothetical protein
MPVVINEFEVVSESPPPSAEPSAPAAPGQLSPREVEAIIQRVMERAARVRAH